MHQTALSDRNATCACEPRRSARGKMTHPHMACPGASRESRERRSDPTGPRPLECVWPAALTAARSRSGPPRGRGMAVVLDRDGGDLDRTLELDRRFERAVRREITRRSAEAVPADRPQPLHSPGRPRRRHRPSTRRLRAHRMVLADWEADKQRLATTEVRMVAVLDELHHRPGHQHPRHQCGRCRRDPRRVRRPAPVPTARHCPLRMFGSCAASASVAVNSAAQTPTHSRPAAGQRAPSPDAYRGRTPG